MKILVDMDNTLNDWSSHFLAYTKMYNWEIDEEKFNNEWASWDSFLNVSNVEAEKRWNKILCDFQFWRSIPIKPYASFIVRDLVNAHDVWIVTALYDKYSACAFDKIVWVSENLSFFDLDKILFEKDKWTIEGDAIIEDKPETLEKYPGVTICFDYPYNRNIETSYRIKSWKEVGDILL